MLKGSGSDVFYLTVAGSRRHIHDQDTFQAFGFRQKDIITLADETLAEIPQAGELTRLVFDDQDNLYWIAAGRRWQVNEWKGVIERADYTGIAATPLDDLLPAALRPDWV